MQITLTDADPDAPEALACLRAYYEVLLANVAGISPQMLALPLADAAAYRAPLGAFMIARGAGVALGCVSLRPLQGPVGEVKRLWVSPEARGRGLARALMTAIESRAADLGYAALKLDSNSALTPAIALYRGTGWADCAPYTGFPADIWMSKRLG